LKPPVSEMGLTDIGTFSPDPKKLTPSCPFDNVIFISCSKEAKDLALNLTPDPSGMRNVTGLKLVWERRRTVAFLVVFPNAALSYNEPSEDFVPATLADCTRVTAQENKATRRKCI